MKDYLSDNDKLQLLRKIALVLVVAGAVISLDLMLQAGHNQKSKLLIFLFTGWILSPFFALLVLNVVAKRWAVLPRKTLYILMLIITVASIFCYSGVFNPVGFKPAFIFLIVPLISWILLVTIIPLAVSRSPKQSDRH